MTREQVWEKLNEVFEEEFDDAEINEHTVAKDVDGWDSLEHVILLGKIEKKFGIKFDFNDIASFDEVGDIVNCVLKKTT